MEDIEFEPGLPVSSDLLLTSTFYHLTVNNSSTPEKNMESCTSFYSLFFPPLFGCLDSVPGTSAEITVFQKRVAMRTNINWVLALCQALLCASHMLVHWILMITHEIENYSPHFRGEKAKAKRAWFHVQGCISKWGVSGLSTPSHKTPELDRGWREEERQVSPKPPKAQFKTQQQPCLDPATNKSACTGPSRDKRENVNIPWRFDDIKESLLTCRVWEWWY